MRGNFFIDGQNAYDAFGVWIVKGGYKDLLKFPAMNRKRTTGRKKMALKLTCPIQSWKKRKSAFLFLPAGIFTSVSFWNIYRLRDIIRSVSLHLKGNGPCVWTARKHAGYIPGQRIFH